MGKDSLWFWMILGHFVDVPESWQQRALGKPGLQDYWDFSPVLVNVGLQINLANILTQLCSFQMRERRNRVSSSTCSKKSIKCLVDQFFIVEMTRNQTKCDFPTKKHKTGKSKTFFSPHVNFAKKFRRWAFEEKNRLQKIFRKSWAGKKTKKYPCSH